MRQGEVDVGLHSAHDISSIFRMLKCMETRLLARVVFYFQSNIMILYTWSALSAPNPINLQYNLRVAPPKDKNPVCPG